MRRRRCAGRVLVAAAALILVDSCGSNGSEGSTGSTPATVARESGSSSPTTSPVPTPVPTAVTAVSASAATTEPETTAEAPPEGSAPTSGSSPLPLSETGLLAGFSDCSSVGGPVVVVDNSGHELASFPLAGHPKWSPDGSRLALVDQYGGGLQVIDVASATATKISEVPVAAGFGECGTRGDVVGWSPDGAMIAYGFVPSTSQPPSYAKEFHVARADGTANATVAPDDSRMAWVTNSMTWTDDGRLVRVAGAAGEAPGTYVLTEINPVTGEAGPALSTFSLSQPYVRNIAVSPSLDVAVFATYPDSPAGQVSVIDLSTGTLRLQVDSATEYVALAPDLTKVAFMTSEGPGPGHSLHLLDVAGGVDTVIAREVPGDTVAWSPSGRTIATGSITSLTLIDVETGQLATVDIGHEVNGMDLAWQPLPD